MKQKKIFARRPERHPVKWTFISFGLFALTFMAFSAGVQFGQMGVQSASASQASTDSQVAYEPTQTLAKRVAY
ncbi:MAG: hypothetical protein EP340_07990 [Alphaproteobacteria bacterium]|nr:MAG: hypothetical protein EP340_07990 [Alphaproteobacteria bacterium]